MKTNTPISFVDDMTIEEIQERIKSDGVHNVILFSQDGTLYKTRKVGDDVLVTQYSNAFKGTNEKPLIMTIKEDGQVYQCKYTLHIDDDNKVYINMEKTPI